MVQQGFWWKALDSLLRGRVLAAERVALFRVWFIWQVACAAVFGWSLAAYSLSGSREGNDGYLFMLANTVKLPALLLLTSIVTCPSLYVFGALRGLRFTALEFVAILFTGHTIMAAVLASFAPVVAFFGLTTRSYSFMILIVVFICALAGGLGLRSFLQAVREPVKGDDGDNDDVATAGPPPRPPDDDEDDAPPPPPPPPKRRGDGLWQVLGWWLALYVFVGAQMSWMLRPFVGNPDQPFELFREKQGSFLESVFDHIGRVFGG